MWGGVLATQDNTEYYRLQTQQVRCVDPIPIQCYANVTDNWPKSRCQSVGDVGSSKALSAARLQLCIGLRNCSPTTGPHAADYWENNIF